MHIAATVEGVRVIAIDVNPAARKKAEELGATASVDATLGDQQVRTARSVLARESYQRLCPTNVCKRGAGTLSLLRLPLASSVDSQWRMGKSSRQVRDLVMELTGEGADVALDAAGFAPTCENAVWCTRRGGRMIQVSNPGGMDALRLPR